MVIYKAENEWSDNGIVAVWVVRYDTEKKEVVEWVERCGTAEQAEQRAKEMERNGEEL